MADCALCKKPLPPSTHVCPDCGVAEDEAAAQRETISGFAFSVLAEYANKEGAQADVTVLLDRGVLATVRDPDIPGDPVTIQVPTDQLEEARTILEALNG